MIDIILATVILLGCVTGNLLANNRQRKAQHNRQIRAIEQAQKLLDLVNLLQQHRGMTGAYLNGQHQYQIQLKQLANQATQIQAELTKIDLIQQLPNWSQAANRLKTLLNTEQHDASDSFNQHSFVIAGVLDLVWQLSEHYQLTTSQQKSLRLQADQALRRLPNLIELLAQMRGLSTLTASKGYCSSAFRLRLVYLADQIHTLFDPSSESAGPAQSFLNLVNQQVIQSEQIKIEPDQLFAAASEAIDLYLNQARALLDSMTTLKHHYGQV